MWEQIKAYVQLVVGFALSFIVNVLSIPIVWLERVFYTLSIYLLGIGIISISKKQKPSKIVQGLEKTTGLVVFADSPQDKGKLVVTTIKKINHGGNKMKNYFKTMSKPHLVSLIAMVVAVIAGIVIALVPELAMFEDALLYVGATFIGSSFVSAFTVGKNAGATLKNNDPRKDKLAQLIDNAKQLEKLLADIEEKNKTIIETKQMIDTYGGQLTTEQSVLYNTYVTQKKNVNEKLTAVKKDIQGVKAELVE